ncbi:MAG TPA: hypothetical protein ENJ53_05290 [Phaeodactylibacter sp.]|nr:hypothetical protein [Phaeodactylibacter sp.]
MKNEILDTPFRDTFSDFLEKGEKILWENQPVKLPLKGQMIFIFLFVFMFLLIFVFMAASSRSASFFSTILVLCIIVILGIVGIYPMYRQFLRQKEVRYAITKRQILFRQKTKKGVEVYSIPIKDIENISVEKNFYKSPIGDISFTMKETKELSFKMNDLASGAPLTYPKIQQVAEVVDVSKLIQKILK